jgi:predicted HTH transcriptional regulator
VITKRPPEYLIDLINWLREEPVETAWLEFKVNNGNPDEIGEYISALANSAALCHKASGYFVWGIDDTTHDVVGTTFAPSKTKMGNEELENWLLQLLDPQVQFAFFSVIIDGKSLILLEVGRADHRPVQFKGVEYVRVGSYKKKLKDYPGKEKELWHIFDSTRFEEHIAQGHLSANDVLQLLDYQTYFSLLREPLPENQQGILDAFASEGLICSCDAGGWDITNLGALLLARQLGDFGTLQQRQVRVIQYRGTTRMAALQEPVFSAGYASGFVGLLSRIRELTPVHEEIRDGLRTAESSFPTIAVRELVANALIHQDLVTRGTSPMVGIFDNRIEISNTGTPLVDIKRLLDSPPRSRNEKLAALMRRMGVCEERGSGWDKIATQVEQNQLLAPLVEVGDDWTRVTMFDRKPLAKMSSSERVRAVYLHACLQYANRGYVTNSSIRQRFGIEVRNSATASRLIKEAVAAKAIAPCDANASPKLMQYVPVWALPNPTAGT